jgi:hypothetical protein
MACSLSIPPVEYMEAAATSVGHFWLASVFLGALVLCLDIYERKASLALLVSGVVLLGWSLILYLGPHWGTYLTDCSVPLLQLSPYVLGLVSVLLAYRVFRTIRSNPLSPP